MLDQSTRRAILDLRERGHGTRTIAKLVGVSRGAVRDVLAQGTAEVPRLARTEKAEDWREQILELYRSCAGNLVRVHEELLGLGAELSYQALTAFCRRHDIGAKPKVPAGRYHFEPGQEMQHDTSPHQVTIGGHRQLVQTASLVLCYSRMIYFQMYPGFDRFTCKLFLAEAIAYMGGACASCMIDNTHVVVLRGTGPDMVPVPEMEAFAERYGFRFLAHRKGDANRSARVERPFDYIERNFIPGRTFADWHDLGVQAKAWCEEKNATFRRHLHAAPRELFATEQPHLRALPPWVPEVYRLHQRIVDTEGFVNVHRHRYSVPYQLMGRMTEVRETKDRITVYVGPREVAAHDKAIGRYPERVVRGEHRPPRGHATRQRRAGEHERRLSERLPEAASYVAAIARHDPARKEGSVVRLLRMASEYPRAALVAAIQTARHYGMYDMERLERMVLANITRDFFPHAGTQDDDDAT